MPENVSSAETPPEEFCHGCRYWQLIGDEFLDGECRRHAPRLSGMAAPHGDAIHQDPKWAMWPTTFRDDCYGEPCVRAAFWSTGDDPGWYDSEAASNPVCPSDGWPTHWMPLPAPPQ